MRRLLFFVFFLSTTQALAKGVSPYLPLKLSPEIESQVEKLMALTPGAPLNKPYKTVELIERLVQIRDDYPQLYQQLHHYLQRFEQDVALTHLDAQVSLSDDTSKTLPNQRNIHSDSHASASFAGQAFLSPYLFASVAGVAAQDNGVIHTGSFIGFGYEYAQVEVGYREHWFSPFQDSAMLISTHAKSSPSITISNATPITDWNFRYEIFYSKLEEVDEIVLGDETFPGHPRLIGMHLSITPFDFWTLGASRTLQFGGGKRDVSFSDIIEAILDPAGKDNVGDVDTDDPNYEFGNQQAAISSKFNFHLWTPVSLYAELAGEDTIAESNFQLGNQALSYGLYLPALTDSFSLRYEYSHWSTAWYVHHLYKQGYTNDGQVMGHWGAGERDLSHDTAATAQSLNLNWSLAENGIIDLTLRTLQNEGNRFETFERASEIDLTYSRPASFGFWGFNIYAGKNVYGENFGRISSFVRW